MKTGAGMGQEASQPRRRPYPRSPPLLRLRHRGLGRGPAHNRQAPRPYPSPDHHLLRPPRHRPGKGRGRAGIVRHRRRHDRLYCGRVAVSDSIGIEHAVRDRRVSRHVLSSANSNRPSPPARYGMRTATDRPSHRSRHRMRVRRLRFARGHPRRLFRRFHSAVARPPRTKGVE